MAPSLPPSPARPDYDEHGIAGTRITGGRIWQYEENTELVGRLWVDAVERMRRTDPVVRQCCWALEQTLMSARWRFQEPANPTPAAVEATAYLNEAFGFDGRRPRLRGGFEPYLTQILKFLPLGWRYLEEVYRVEDGKVWLDRYADREPIAHSRWLTTESGELAGVEQYRSYGVNGYGVPSGNPTIPANKLVLFTVDRTGSNFEGLGLLRPCYFPWKLKKHAWDMIAIALERFAVPTPRVKINREVLRQQGYSDPQITEIRDKALANAKALTSHELGYLVEVEGLTFETFGDGVFDPSDALTVVDKTNEEIVSAFLLSFARLGVNDTGSRAVGEVQEAFFRRLAINVLDYVAQVIGGPAGPGCGTAGRLLDWNYPDLPSEQRPILTHDGLEAKSLIDLATSGALSALVQQGVWTPDDATEAQLRHDSGAPALSLRRTPAERLGIAQGGAGTSTAVAAAADLAPEPLDDVPGAPTYTPPRPVRMEAARGIEEHREHRQDVVVDPSWLVFGRKLASGAALSGGEVMRMNAWHDAHAADARPDGSAARIGWLLHGGAPGAEWADTVEDEAAAGVPAEQTEQE